MKTAVDLLKKPSTWVVIVAIVLAVTVWRNGRRWWQQLTRRDQGNYAGQPSVPSNPARQGELQQLARDTYTVINSVSNPFERERVLERVVALNDTELRYVAKFYQSSISESAKSLREDVLSEWMPFTDVDERLVTRLNQLAL